MDNDKTAPGFDEEMREIFESYLVEAREILDHLSLDLLALEKAPSDMNVLNNILTYHLKELLAFILEIIQTLLQ